MPVKHTYCSFKITTVPFTAPISDSLELPVAVILGDPTPSSGPCRHLHTHVHTQKLTKIRGGRGVTTGMIDK